MIKRPLLLTILGLVLIATGAGGLVLDFISLKKQNLFQYDVVLVPLVHLAAIVAGVCLLRARNWARWLSLAWMGFHVAISFFHSRFELTIHTLAFAAFAFILFHPRTNKYFRHQDR